ncbi:uncharacterized protein LOC120251962 [Dioscorea cayenensis subsp. rotundata]|uniref:Uncharacterized protein LOC120251962 n=1 Tax=Dioscorea cayennensis subsp. rotundata TaxID=55577 RepID=A0AB40ANW4_DIOCR|nr:uncharacterized protein LOC120251962 [Dioscorea cayenensis subsp. rotundata]
MTGGSLGLRSGSYGSLQAQINGSSAVVAVSPLPTHSTPPPPPSARKPSKMLLPGSRDKERCLAWICKLAGRRRVGMLLLLIASAAVLLSFSIVSKDYDVSAGSETNLNFSDQLKNITNIGRGSTGFSRSSLIPSRDDNRVNSSPPPPFLGLEQLQANIENETWSSPASLLQHYQIPARHPCEHFAFPPPPADKKRTGPRPCPVCYVPVEHALAVMPASQSPSPILQNLTYFSDENLLPNESNASSLFGGQPSLQQRNESFDIKESMTVHCGFVKGKKLGQGTGFNMDEDALLEMEQCHGVVVASAIFGNYDILQQPKNMSDFAKQNACFYMFVDEETEAYIRNTSTWNDSNRVGLWRVVVVRNLPYTDARRNGKIPKLLLHRIFPNARFSIWIDGKLELVVDPYQILERFLWRVNATFAISKHYRRFDVFEEAEANKAAGKYVNASIDYQIEFYRSEGLTHYSSAKLPIVSDVPEGCVIIREHTPITNLFTCLWFNEVDRFTSRDQISFSTVRDKIMAKVDWRLNMFMDCERRNFVIQAYHKDLLDQRKLQSSSAPPPPNALLFNEASPKSTTSTAVEVGKSTESAAVHVKSTPETTVEDGAGKTPALRKPPPRRGRDRKSGSKHRRPRPLIPKDFTPV